MLHDYDPWNDDESKKNYPVVIDSDINDNEVQKVIYEKMYEDKHCTPRRKLNLSE